MSKIIDIPRIFYWLNEKLYENTTTDVSAYGINAFRYYDALTHKLMCISPRPRVEAYSFLAFGKTIAGSWDEGSLKERDIFPSEAIAFESSTHPNRIATHLHDTIFFHSLKNRFTDKAEWEETQFIQKMIRTAPHPDWPSYYDKEKILDKCRSVDDLYANMAEHGFKTVKEYYIETGKVRPYRHVLKNEIIVDLDRNGDMLFFDGKHRVAIAMLLGIPVVRVVVMVRHTELFAVERSTM